MYNFAFKNTYIGYNGIVLCGKLRIFALEVSNYRSSQGIPQDSYISVLKVTKSVYFASITFGYLGNFAVFNAKLSFWLPC